MNTTTAATGEDVIQARHRDALACVRDRPATDQEMRDLPAAAVAWGFPRLSPDERDDLASEVRIHLARRHGWNPPRSALDRPLLARRAATLYRDIRKRWADVSDASAATDADERGEDAATRTDAAASWAGASLPAAASDWREVATGLGFEPDSQAGLAVFAALSGYGTGAEVATVLGITEPSARKRLSRGRAVLAKRFRSPDALADALADADLLDSATADAPVMADSRRRPAVTFRRDSGRVVTLALAPGERSMLARLVPTNAALVTGERVRLDSERRAIRRVLDRIAPTDTLPHVARQDADPRLAALATVIGPAAVGRVQPERVSLPTRRSYRLAGEPTVTLPRRDRTPTVDSADADAAWTRANTRRPRAASFRPMTVAQADAETADRVNRAALASWRVSRPWDRRRAMSRSRLGGSSLI